jgi:hypothetical protein
VNQNVLAEGHTHPNLGAHAKKKNAAIIRQALTPI